jgi:LysM repeat protein
MKNRAIILLILLSFNVFAQQGRKITRAEYIEAYKDLAMAEMEEYGIPASIILAQGAFESGDGNSRLARKGNNHFGIKCHDWNGKTIHEDDDENNECFRKYKSVKESYNDHSEFLTNRQRYAFLFKLSPDDYKGWARGLKEAGYATNPNYSNAIIKVIEDYELYKYDQIVIAKTGGKTDHKKSFDREEFAGNRKVLYNNRVKYVIARQGETFADLSEELDLLSWQLPKYNDMKEEAVLSEGEKIYLQPKRNRGDVSNKIHIVKPGETLSSISQYYAVKLDKLAKHNLLSVNSELKPGDQILLRGRKKGVPVKSDKPKLEFKDNQPKEEFKVNFDSDK